MGLKLVIFEFAIKLAFTGSKMIADHYRKLTLDLLTLQKIKIIEIHIGCLGRALKSPPN